MSVIKAYYSIFPELNKKGEEIGEVGRPFLDIQMNYKRGKIFGPIRVLVDSGSGYNLFPSEVGEFFGINVKKGKPRDVIGIGENRIKVFRHNGIKIFVEGFSFETFIDFGDQITVPLLGQQGFFDKFKEINFLSRSETFTLMY